MNRHTFISLLMGLIWVAIVVVSPGEVLGKSISLKRQFFENELKSRNLSAAERLRCFDSLLAINPEQTAVLNLGKANTLRDMGKIRDAIAIYETIQSNSRISEEDRLDIKYSIGACYNQIGQPWKTLSYGYDMLLMPKPDSLKYCDARAYLNFANGYLSLQDYDKAQTSAQKGLAILESLEQQIPEWMYRRIKSGLLNAKAMTLYYTDRYFEAYKVLLETRKLVNESEIPSVDLNIACMLEAQGERHLSDSIYQAVIENPAATNEARAKAAYIFVNSILEQKGPKAYLECRKQYVEVLNFLNGTSTETALIRLDAQAMEEIGRYKDALDLYHRADSLDAAILPPEAVQEIDDINKAMAQGIDDNVALRNEVPGWSLISGVVILLMLLLIVWLLYRGRQTRREMRLVESQIEVANVRHSKDIESLNCDLGLKEQIISRLALQLGNLNAHLETLQEMVNDSKTKKPDIVRKIVSILREIQSEEEIWDGFIAHYEKVDRRIFQQLYNRHPNLSKAEVRMCAFILLNLTNKETAAMLHRSVRTVETIKYNLRRKLNISVPTEVYLRSLGQ